MKRSPEIFTVPPGVELNYGFWEDSDSVVTTRPTTLVVAGELNKGALPVRIKEGEQVSNEIFYFHQPESNPFYQKKDHPKE